jgi:hypothetical protein
VFVELAKQHYAAEIQRVMAHVETANPKAETVRVWVAVYMCSTAAHAGYTLLT